MKHIKLTLAAALTASLLGAPAFAGDRSASDTVSDAWIDGSVETALLFSQHLNNFEIDTDVKDGVVTLSGAVESDVDRDLAGEIAKGISGVHSVDNQLTVDGKPSKIAVVKSKASAEARDFRQWFDDVSTTAAVKSKLLANNNTHGLKINVTTQSDVVSLEGTVKSEQEAELAETIASNVAGIERVENRLVVASR
jgi:hyperosmotically inducible protein